MPTTMLSRKVINQITESLGSPNMEMMMMKYIASQAIQGSPSQRERKQKANRPIGARAEVKEINRKSKLGWTIRGLKNEEKKENEKLKYK